MAISFPDDSYFITVGHRHVKFWFLDSSREAKVNLSGCVARGQMQNGSPALSSLLAP